MPRPPVRWKNITSLLFLLGGILLTLVAAYRVGEISTLVRYRFKIYKNDQRELRESMEDLRRVMDYFVEGSTISPGDLAAGLRRRWDFSDEASFRSDWTNTPVQARYALLCRELHLGAVQTGPGYVWMNPPRNAYGSGLYLLVNPVEEEVLVVFGGIKWQSVWDTDNLLPIW